MICNLKAAAIGFTATIAISVAIVGTAAASEGPLFASCGTYPCVITGEAASHPEIGAVHRFATPAGTITCEETFFDATIASAEESDEVTLTPTYSKCKASGLPATWTMNGCDYKLHGGVEASESHFVEGTTDIVCPEGKKIEVHIYSTETKHKEGVSLCTITIGPQTLGGNTFENTAEKPDDVDLVTSTEVDIEIHGSKVLCTGGKDPTTTVKATYTGTTTLRAYGDKGNDTNEAGETVYTEGSQVGLTISDTQPPPPPALFASCGTYPCVITGEAASHPEIGAVHRFATPAGTITCEETFFDATIASAEESDEVTLTPTYSKCKASGLPATWTMNGCDYKLHGGVEASESHFVEGTTDIVCPEGKKIEVHIYSTETKHKEGVSLCTITIGPQTLGGNTFENTAEKPDDVDLVTSTEVDIEIHGSKVLCTGGKDPTTTVKATYTGTTTLRAYGDKGNDTNEAGETVYTEGSQVGLTISDTQPPPPPALFASCGTYPCVITGEAASHPEIGAVHRFATPAGTITCEETFFDATIASAEESDEVTLTPTYSKCKASGLPATWTMNGCDYKLHGGVEASESHFVEGTTDIVCPEGKKIEVHIYSTETKHKEGVSLCTITIGPQTLGGNTFENTAEKPDDVDLVTSTEVDIEIHGSKVLCTGGKDPTTTVKATYTGTTTLRAYGDKGNDTNEAGETVYTEGSQVGLTISE